MLRHRLLFAALAALGMSAAAALPARAQSSYAGGGPVSGYTSGSQIDRRPLVPVTAYPASTLYLPGYRGTMWSPIFMTSINYPGVYGAYTLSGVANNSLFFREPMVYPRDNSSVVSPVSTTITPPAYSSPLMDAGFRVTASGPGGLRTTAAPGTAATVRVRVPSSASVFFEGEPTAATGPDRLFESPPLAPGRSYRYDIKAVWEDNGREVVRTRSVTVHAGERVSVNFLNNEEPPTLRTRPSVTTPPLPESATRPATPGAPPERARDQGLPATQSLSPAVPTVVPGRPANPAPPTPDSNRRRALERAPGRPSGP
jgi:uncharacterized protein (TIGR03000 family)